MWNGPPHLVRVISAQYEGFSQRTPALLIVAGIGVCWLSTITVWHPTIAAVPLRHMDPN